MGRIQQDPARTTQIKESLVERVFLYLESTRDKVLPGAFKLLESLEVVAVTNISIERRIKFSRLSSSKPVSDRITACLGRNSTQEAHTLYVVPGSLEWFDVSQALIGLLVNKPSPDSVIVLETMLTSSLKGLQRKGFNVDRILRKKQKEQEEADALVEAEREKLKAETQERIRNQKSMVASNNSEKALAPTSSEKTLATTGSEKSLTPSNGNMNNPQKSWNEKGDTNRHNPNLTPGIPPVMPISNSQRSFFSRIFKAPPTPSSSPALPPPPRNPMITNTPSSQNSPMPGPSSGGGGPVGQEKDNSSILDQGIRGSKPFSSNSLSGPPRAPAPAPDEVSTEKECNFQEASSLHLVTRLQGGPSIYLGEGMPELTEQWIKEAVRFKSILFMISQNIFGISWEAIHIYLNTNSSVIAFNYGGSLFFNLSYFIGNTLTPSRQPGQANWNPVGQLDYWFTVFAHELAHNLCQPHGSTHSYYT